MGGTVRPRTRSLYRPGARAAGSSPPPSPFLSLAPVSQCKAGVLPLETAGVLAGATAFLCNHGRVRLGPKPPPHGLGLAIGTRSAGRVFRPQRAAAQPPRPFVRVTGAFRAETTRPFPTPTLAECTGLRAQSEASSP